jgi:hypothetical protein
LRVFLSKISRIPMENEMRFLAISFCALALIPAASGAQQSAAPQATLPALQATGPTLQAAAVGFRVAETKVDASTAVTAAPIRRGAGRDVALMVVGVGAMIAGALIGDTAGTIIIIGGAGMALYGLYNYLE